MQFSEDDDGRDIGTILLTVIVTVALGALAYAYGSSRSVMQTAYIPAIERTVPNIVPNQPQF
jgi:hypothetical protein